MSMSPAHFIFLVMINLVWAFAIIAVEFGMRELSPFLFLLLRFLIISALLVPFLKFHRGRMFDIAVIAVTAGGIQFGFFYGAIYISHNIPAVVMAAQLGVPFTTLLGFVFLQEKVGWQRWLGMALAFFGVCILVFDPDVFGSILGIALGTCAACFGAVGSIFMRRIQGVKPFELQAWIALISWPPLLMLTFTFETGLWESITNATWIGWTAVAFTAIVSNMFAHAGMFFLLQRYEVSTIAPLTLMAPIMTIALSVPILGDVLTWQILLGGAICLSGVLIVTLRRPAEAVRDVEVTH